jgi:hypothetical protein
MLMSHDPTPNQEDPRLAALLRAVEAEIPPPDPAVLASLRQRTTAAFMESAPAHSETQKRRSPRMLFLLRSAITAAAAALLFTLWLTFGGPRPLAAAPSFSKVMAELRKAQTLQLEVKQADETMQVWVRAPGLVRRQHTPQQYEIAAGSRLWKIDEATNTVTEGDSPWFLDPHQQVDLLGLLGLGVKDAATLLKAEPSEQRSHDGRDCFVYRAILPAKEGRIQIEALVAVKDLELVEIVARPNGAQGNANPPLAELRLIAMNGAVDDEKFVVTKSLTEDGRIGKVSDAQGVVVLRPMLAKRWTPVCRETLLKPGDWLRTDLRGPNAIKASLSSEVELTLGPGTLVECVSPVLARIHHGQVQVMSPKRDKGEKDVSFTLLAPRQGSREFHHGDKQLVRVDREEKLQDVPQTPVWLAGFEGTSNNESLGSLIVNLPDGRNEPLTVGYHKVSVEIRDQIARTTIEESFVNHTTGRLEGTFHFPLPQDASISGFGMWIGNDLVEADVVEKQRAREIYETILRERRDPGLLEWTGGNLFKARVFPIEGRSEKRIKIVYTQVLPLRAGRYRYSYGLRSELLRTKPLRELSLSVLVNSTLPLKSVTCPTHSVRSEQKAHSAQVDFMAQEYTPNRDFEVVCEIDGRQSDVVVVPHRRGSDGYFLVQLTPPAPDGNWQREVLPEGKPLSLVLLCDTSSSMDLEKRKQQAECVATLLSSLGPDDRFMLAAADVTTVWAFSEPTAPHADNLAKARAFLDERLSLGWTNLDRAFDDVIKKAPADAHVIYLGDGIVSAGDTDPAAFVKRFELLIGRENKSHRVFHAVTLGNSYESVVLKGIAAAGGGSVRAIAGEQTPQTVAMELLNEMAQPGLRDMNLEFRGLKVAAVYPNRLPNVPAGTQQILVGRYLPEGKDQQGEIVVTGLRGSEQVRYAAKVSFKDAEEGNSFIPRLWARSHLDHLLAQGQSQAIQGEIIALSEEFHIITPYTSLLVLETDADRERFGVQRRYEMRDGERFFAEGRDNANYELLQAQMKRAGDWRIGLRRQVLQSLASLGRNPRVFQQQIHMLDLRRWNFGGGSHDYNRPPMATAPMSSPASLSASSSPFGFGRNGEDGYFDRVSGMGGGGDLDLGELNGDLSTFALTDAASAADEARSGLSGSFNEVELSLGLADSDSDVRQQLGESLFVTGDDSPPSEPMGQLSSDYFSRLKSIEAKKRESLFDDFEVSSERLFFSKSNLSDIRLPGLASSYQGYYGYPDYTSWLNTLFPGVEPRVVKPAAIKEPETWSPEAIALTKSLLRTESLLKLAGGIELKRTTDYLDPHWQRRSSRSSDLVLYSPTAWVTRNLDPRQQTLVNFCNPTERGVYSLAFLLGRVRASAEHELRSPPLGLDDGSLVPLFQVYASYAARVEAAGENRVKLILSLKNSEGAEHFTIDTARHVVVQRDGFSEGKSNLVWTYEDFVEVGGSWWAKKSVLTDSKGRTTRETTLDVQSLAKEQYDQRIAAELSSKTMVQFARLPFAKLNVARQKVADGPASFDDRLAMILHNASLQQWDEMWKQVDAAEKISLDKPGVRWLRTMLLATIRRNEEVHQRLLEEARKLAAAQQQDEMFLAEFVLNQAHNLMGSSELLDLVQLLKPVYERQPADLEVLPQWQEQLAQCHEGLGHHEESLALRRAMAEAAPWRLDWQTDYARRLAIAGDVDAAFAWLQKELARPIDRAGYEVESLKTAIADLYRTQVRWADLLKFTTQWIAAKPAELTYHSAYSQHLSALVYNDQLAAADALVDQWLKEARVPGKLAPEQRSRFEAALNFACGNAYNLSFNRMDERWFEPIAETIRFFLRHKHHAEFAARGMDNGQFSQSDVADRLRGEFLTLLQTDLAGLTPAEISSLLRWTLSGRLELKEPLAGRKQLNASEIPDEIWRKIATELKPRWLQSQDKDEKHLLGESLRTIYATRFQETELLPFLRERIASAPGDYKAAYVAALFDGLLAAPWTAAIEQEAFARLNDLAEAKEPVDRLMVQVAALYRLVDAMIANRQASGERQLADQGEQDKLTRKDLAAKKMELRSAAQVGVAARLVEMAAKEKGPLAPWLQIEQIRLDVGLNQNLNQVEAQCWKILGETPPKQEEDADEDAEGGQGGQRFFDSVLKHRALTTVMNLATRRKAEPATVDRVLKYLDAGAAQGGEAAAAWRSTKFRMLVALDRPDDLERDLRGWIRDDVSTAPWRQMLARLLAERGKLDEAIELFEAADKDKLLSASDWRMLADWYLVSSRRADYERSRVESFKRMPENRLANMLYQTCNRWNRRDQALPSELDENTLFALRALFEKSASPEHYLHQLRDLYASSRDFRLLDMLPDAVLGRSPQQIYAFLNSVQGHVLYELRNEASADEILSRIKKLREGDRTLTDLRALDLLEALVERKSSEVLNQPGPHVEACLAALQRAFQRKWADGEPRMMSSLLYQLGTLRNPKLIEEQMREFRELQKLAPAAGRDHLLITSDLSNILFWSYDRKDEAIREMEAEVRVYEQAHDGIWPQQDNEVYGRYVALYEGARQHAAGEAILLKRLARPDNDEQRKWLNDRLTSLYNHALEHQGEVSLGQGAKLFENLVARALKELDASNDENVRYNIVVRLVTTFDIARRRTIPIPGVAEALRKFAFETMPVLLKRQQSQYRNTATVPLHVIGDLLGPKLCLQYIVERMEQYPERLEISWDTSWNAFGYELARRRADVSSEKQGLGDLEPRVLKLAIRKLQRELRTGETSSHHIYHDHHAYFWREKKADFAQAAEAVLAERKTSGRRAMLVAQYLWRGLDLHSRAIEILLQAHKDGLLDENSQVQLVVWLHERNRHAESIPLLEPLVAVRPDVMTYRTHLMIAYHRSQRPEQLKDLTNQTDAFFHKEGRWTEANITQFARGLFDCSQWERGIGYFKEAIALHQRNSAGQGLDDGALSELYRHVALAQSALGRTREAVDAASAAIICWSPRHEQRTKTLELLTKVLRDSKDLDEFVQHLDQESAKTGQDSPIIRKAIGKTYQFREEYLKAITQLQLAVAIQPNDKETRQALIVCYDAMKNGSAATHELLALIELNSHDLTLYQQLAERLKDNESEAERAATSIIESSPNEAESHAALAELRQKQNRWSEALPHWEQVAQLRRLEPTGLLKLAEAQVHEKQWSAAQKSIETLQRTEWPQRFSDLPNQIRRLQEQVPKR